MKKLLGIILSIVIYVSSFAQQKWVNLDSVYQPLPASMHVYRSTDSVDGKPNVMYYAIAELADRNLIFTADTTKNRRLTPAQ